ncbi:MAG: hypothetical protein ACLFR1_12250 [Spirochaetia bacterium]
MKKALLIGILFIFSYLISLLLLTAGIFIASWGITFLPGRDFGRTWIFLTFVQSLRNAAIPAFVLSMFIAFFSIIKKNAYGFLSSLLLFIFSFVALTSMAFLTMSVLPSISVDRYQEQYPILAEHLNPYEENIIFAESINGTVVNTLFYAKLVSIESRFVLKRNAILDLEEQEIIVPGPEENIPIGERNPFFGPMFQSVPQVQNFFTDIQTVTNTWQEIRQNSSLLLFLLHILSFVFFAVSCSFFLRFSHWPLINAFILLIVMRGVFAAYSLLSKEFVQFLSEIELFSGIDVFIVPIVFLLCASILSILSLLKTLLSSTGGNS